VGQLRFKHIKKALISQANVRQSTRDVRSVHGTIPEVTNFFELACRLVVVPGMQMRFKCPTRWLVTQNRTHQTCNCKIQLDHFTHLQASSTVLVHHLNNSKAITYKLQYVPAVHALHFIGTGPGSCTYNPAATSFCPSC